jgi:cytosine deaminase
MTTLLVRNARHVAGGAPVDVVAEGGTIKEIRPAAPQDGAPAAGATVIDAEGGLLAPPFVEPHIHLDAVLTAGEPSWNESGTLWEGIQRWTERKPSLTRQDVVDRATEVLRWHAAHGVLHVRTHVDVCDPRLVALDALLEVRERVRDVIGLQIVAFPQEGIRSFDGGAELLEEAMRRGADAVGAIPHFEDTREDGVGSLEIAFALAERYDRMVDVHCDEIDDEQSRFVEVVATLAARTGLRERATASHTTAMGSYNGAYAFKLMRILQRSGINVIANPLINITLQGRFDTYPKRRGLTRVKELLDAGINVSLGADDVMDPWYSLGTGNALDVAHMAVHVAHMTGRAEVDETFEMVTERAARALGLGERYGLAPGRPASFVVLQAADRFDAVRRRLPPRLVVSHGAVVARAPRAASTLTWPGRAEESVESVRAGDGAAGAG